jgi:hypothetical protein
MPSSAITKHQPATAVPTKRTGGDEYTRSTPRRRTAVARVPSAKLRLHSRATTSSTSRWHARKNPLTRNTLKYATFAQSL